MSHDLGLNPDEVAAIITVIGAVGAAVVTAVVALIVLVVKMRRSTHEMRAEFQPNHGSSLRDSIDRIEKRQTEHHEQNMRVNDRQDRQIEALRSGGEQYARRTTRELAEIRTVISQHHPEA